MNALKISLLCKGEPFSMYIEGTILGNIITTEYAGKETYYWILTRFDKKYAMVMELNWLGRHLLL